MSTSFEGLWDDCPFGWHRLSKVDLMQKLGQLLPTAGPGGTRDSDARRQIVQAVFTDGLSWREVFNSRARSLLFLKELYHRGAIVEDRPQVLTTVLEQLQRQGAPVPCTMAHKRQGPRGLAPARGSPEHAALPLEAPPSIVFLDPTAVLIPVVFQLSEGGLGGGGGSSTAGGSGTRVGLGPFGVGTVVAAGAGSGAGTSPAGAGAGSSGGGSGSASASATMSATCWGGGVCGAATQFLLPGADLAWEDRMLQVLQDVGAKYWEASGRDPGLAPRWVWWFQDMGGGVRALDPGLGSPKCAQFVDAHIGGAVGRLAVEVPSAFSHSFTQAWQGPQEATAVQVLRRLSLVVVRQCMGGGGGRALHSVFMLPSVVLSSPPNTHTHLPSPPLQPDRGRKLKRPRVVSSALISSTSAAYVTFACRGCSRGGRDVEECSLIIIFFACAHVFICLYVCVRVRARLCACMRVLFTPLLLVTQRGPTVAL